MNRKALLLAPLLALSLPLLAQSDNPAVNYRAGKALRKQLFRMQDTVSKLCRTLLPAEDKDFRSNPHFPKYAQIYVNVKGQATAEQYRKKTALFRKAHEKAQADYSKVVADRLDKQYWGVPSCFPVGTVLTKEKFGNPQGKGIPELLTVMVKHERGYNPACYDWEFLVIDGKGSRILERGKLERCQGCHTRYQRTDGVATLSPYSFLNVRGSR